MQTIESTEDKFIKCEMNCKYWRYLTALIGGRNLNSSIEME